LRFWSYSSMHRALSMRLSISSQTPCALRNNLTRLLTLTG